MSTTNADSLHRESAFVFRGLDRCRLTLSEIAAYSRKGFGVFRRWRRLEQRRGSSGKRNLERFPADFMFQLSFQEIAGLRSHFVTLNVADAGR